MYMQLVIIYVLMLYSVIMFLILPPRMCLLYEGDTPLHTAYCLILSVCTAYGLILGLRTAYRLTTKTTFFGRFHLLSNLLERHL